VKCEFEYCIYNENYKCVLDEVTINNLGMCEECMLITLDSSFLDSERKRQRKEIDERQG